jgi:hypothetical protein
VGVTTARAGSGTVVVAIGMFVVVVAGTVVVVVAGTVVVVIEEDVVRARLVVVGAPAPLEQATNKTSTTDRSSLISLDCQTR